ncbi:hypothetical protein PMAC_003379 [Pneumocystis sp. 'macacae']|nr:hypothetical protein PMAC_003379 [Pneumocystis sp. 'macacae']
MDENKEFLRFLNKKYYNNYDFEWFNNDEKKKIKMTEAEFMEQKNAWRPKIEDRDILSKISIPIPRPADKFSLIELKSAAEEQYYLRNYQLSLNYVNDLLKPKNPNFPTDCNLCGAEKKEMEYLRDMCFKKLSSA